MDKLCQIFVEPEDFFFLNLSEKSVLLEMQSITEALQYDQENPENHNYWGMSITLDVQVNISKRTVKDFFLIFGEVGGLTSIFIALSTSLISRW